MKLNTVRTESTLFCVQALHYNRWRHNWFHFFRKSSTKIYKNPSMDLLLRHKISENLWGCSQSRRKRSWSFSGLSTSSNTFIKSTLTNTSPMCWVMRERILCFPIWKWKVTHHNSLATIMTLLVKPSLALRSNWLNQATKAMNRSTIRWLTILAL